VYKAEIAIGAAPVFSSGRLTDPIDLSQGDRRYQKQTPGAPFAFPGVNWFEPRDSVFELFRSLFTQKGVERKEYGGV
jgi:hypothetical protein